MVSDVALLTSRQIVSIRKRINGFQFRISVPEGNKRGPSVHRSGHVTIDPPYRTADIRTLNSRAPTQFYRIVVGKATQRLRPRVSCGVSKWDNA